MIVTKLLDHQRYLLGEAIRKAPRVALWADAGIGKSLVALAYAEAIGARSVLVTCDRQNIDRTWPVEVQKHTDFNLSYLDKGKHLENYSSSTRVYLVSHDWLKYHVDQVNLDRYDLWIGDESADYKNPRTLRMQGLRQVLDHINQRLIMSAFPVSERLEDVFGQMLCLDDGFALGQYITHFRNKYMLPDPCSQWGWVPRADAVDRIREDVQGYLVALPDHIKPVMPPRSYQVQYVPLHPGAKKAYNKLRAEFNLNVLGEDLNLTMASSQFIKLFELSNGFVYAGGDEDSGQERRYERFDTHKLDAVKALVEDIPGKCVIWTHFKAEQDLISKELDCPCFLYRGGKMQLDQFKSFKGKSCLLISLSYAKGLNDLVDVHDVIIYSMPWAYITLAQAEMRTCRIDGAGETRYHRLVVSNTVDEKIYNLIMAKQEFTASVDNFKAMVD